MVLFFFQAEDGIRDVAVTGVQTCALPICLDLGICGSHSRCPPLWVRPRSFATTWIHSAGWAPGSESEPKRQMLLASPSFLLTGRYLSQKPAGSHVRCEFEGISRISHFLLPN